MRSAGKKGAQSPPVDDVTPVQRRSVGRRRTELPLAAASPSAVVEVAVAVVVEEPGPEPEPEPEQAPAQTPKFTTKTATPAPPEPKSTKPPKTKKYKAILPGFAIPPGMLDQTGSAWTHGRRISRRNTISARPSPPPPPTTAATTKKSRKSLGDAHNKPHPPQPQPQPIKRATPETGSTGGSARARGVGASILGASTTTTVPPEWSEPKREAEKQMAKPRSTSGWGLNQLRKARALRGAGEDGRMDRVLSAGIEDREAWAVGETPQKASEEKVGKTPGGRVKKTPAKKAKAKAKVMETPATAAVAAVGTGRRLTRGSAGKGRLAPNPNPEFEFSDEE